MSRLLLALLATAPLLAGAVEVKMLAGTDGNAVIEERMVPGVPFRVFAVSPKTGAADYRPGRITLPALRVTGFAVKPVAQGTGGLTPVDGHSGSFGYLAVAEAKSRRGVVAAWLTNERASGVIRSRFDADGAVVIEASAEYGRMLVKAGSEQKPDLFVFGVFDDCRLGLEAYADAIASHYSIRLPAQISGYTTWYDDKWGYSHRSARWPDGCGAGTAESAREFADAVEKYSLADYGFTFYQIDDYWQAGDTRINGPARDFSKVRENGPFAEGFVPTTSYLRDRRILSGLWFMPFGGLAKEPFFADKQDIFAVAAADYEGKGRAAKSDAVGIASAQKKGKPFATVWGGDCVDMTKPEGRAYVADLCRRITREWGFGYIKFDGMWTGHGGDLMGGATWREDHYDNVAWADETKTGVEAFRIGLGVMREACAPGTFILACNAAQNARSIPASYGVVDAMRIGGDNGPIDMFPARFDKGPKAGTPRYFFSNRVWYNDPDPVYVRDAVPLGRARVYATWAAHSGALFNFSDYLPALSAERVDLLRRTLAPHRCRNVRPIDYFENPVANAWVLEKDGVKVFALYNWNTNTAMTVDYPAAYAGLDPQKNYVGFDFWRNEFVPAFTGALRFTVAADDCRVISVVEAGKQPALLSTSRHVASPVTDVSGVAWSDAGELRGVSSVVRGDRYELRLYVPPCWKAVSWTQGGVTERISSDSSALRLAFMPKATGEVEWKVLFVRK